MRLPSVRVTTATPCVGSEIVRVTTLPWDTLVAMSSEISSRTTVNRVNAVALRVRSSPYMVDAPPEICTGSVRPTCRLILAGRGVVRPLRSKA